MRKIAVIFSLIYLTLYVLLSTIGQRGEFAAEKMLWKINHKATRVLQDTNNIPKPQSDKIIKDYQKFLSRYADTKIGPSGYFQMVKLYWVLKDFEKSRLVSQELIKKYTSRPEIAAQGHAQIALSYTQEGNVPKAIETYNIILADLPHTLTGLNTPIFIAQTYIHANDTAAADKAFDEAINYYMQMVSKHPQSVIAMQSIKLSAHIYTIKKQWGSAVKEYGDILIQFGKKINPAIANEIVKAINTITLTQTKDYIQAIEIYAAFIKQYPQHPFNTTFRKLISELEQLKNTMDAS